HLRRPCREPVLAGGLQLDAGDPGRAPPERAAGTARRAGAAHCRRGVGRRGLYPRRLGLVMTARSRIGIVPTPGSCRAARTNASMRNARRFGFLPVHWLLVVPVLIAILSAPMVATAETVALDRLLSAVVHIKTTINPDGRSVDTLGRERDGSGI